MILLSNSGFGAARQDMLEIIYRAFFDPTAGTETPMLLDYGLN